MKIVNHPRQPFFQSLAAKIDQQCDGQFHQSQIREHLFFVHGFDDINRFHFDDQAVLNQQVDFETIVEFDAVVRELTEC